MKIQPRAPARARVIEAVPATPTHCRGCGQLLELLRRYAGLCKACVAKRAKAVQRRRPLRVLREFVQGGEKFVEVQCACGGKRIMRRSTYNAQLPQSCRACRRREVAQNGVVRRRKKREAAE